MKKRKLKKSIIFLIILIILIPIIIYYFRNNNNSKKYYKEETTQVIKENNYQDIYDYDYSKTLEIAIQNNQYNEIYLEEYIKIDYIERDDFISYVNKYLSIGYNGQEINNIFKLSIKNQNKILNYDKLDFEKYLTIKNFNIDNLERYNNYLKENNKDIQIVVTHVNINLDKEFYSDLILVEDPHSITALINKYHYVDKDFVPNDLVVLFDSKNNAKMVKDAADAYKKFIEAATKDGYTFESTTAYRSYSFQNTLYTNYVKEDGVTKADTYSARPGTSEHQLGLAVDLNNPNYSSARLNDKDYEYILNNSYKYGFIDRYTEEGVPITGYMEEPWHLRYLGVELATKVYESNLTYDEYYDLYMTEY